MVIVVVITLPVAVISTKVNELSPSINLTSSEPLLPVIYDFLVLLSIRKTSLNSSPASDRPSGEEYLSYIH